MRPTSISHQTRPEFMHCMMATNVSTSDVPRVIRQPSGAECKITSAGAKASAPKRLPITGAKSHRRQSPGRKNCLRNFRFTAAGSHVAINKAPNLSQDSAKMRDTASGDRSRALVGIRETLWAQAGADSRCRSPPGDAGIYGADYPSSGREAHAGPSFGGTYMES